MNLFSDIINIIKENWSDYQRFSIGYLLDRIEKIGEFTPLRFEIQESFNKYDIKYDKEREEILSLIFSILLKSSILRKERGIYSYEVYAINKQNFDSKTFKYYNKLLYNKQR